MALRSRDAREPTGLLMGCVGVVPEQGQKSGPGARAGSGCAKLVCIPYELLQEPELLRIAVESAGWFLGLSGDGEEVVHSILCPMCAAAVRGISSNALLYSGDMGEA